MHHWVEIWGVCKPLEASRGNNCCVTICDILQEEITEVFTPAVFVAKLIRSEADVLSPVFVFVLKDSGDPFRV